jgi:hypothetical protein
MTDHAAADTPCSGGVKQVQLQHKITNSFKYGLLVHTMQHVTNSYRYSVFWSCLMEESVKVKDEHWKYFAPTIVLLFFYFYWVSNDSLTVHGVQQMYQQGIRILRDFYTTMLQCCLHAACTMLLLIHCVYCQCSRYKTEIRFITALHLLCNLCMAQ